MRNRTLSWILMVALLSLSLVTAMACSSTSSKGGSAADFYKGKTIRFIVSSDAGGGTDLAARNIAPFLGKETGANVKVENQGTDEGTNYVYNQAPKDGTVVVIKSTNAVVGNDILKAPGTLYEADKYLYVADVNPSAKVMQISPKLPYKTLDDFRKAKGLKGGGTTAKGALALSAAVTFEVLGLDGKVITGFKGKKNLTLALARGEVDFMVTNDDGATKDEEDGYVKNFVTISAKRSAIAKDTPTIFEMGVKVPKELEAAHKYVSSGGTAVALPPGVPQDRVEFLRAAFMKVSDNKDFQEETKKLNNGVARAFSPGKELQDEVATIKANKDLASQLDTIFDKYKGVQ
ncbi:MAG: tripartite tricarboxylate transporter substrate-binding protein [Chloroflexi bacterium]|nr:tripartite tricarboxylate transporter substrate-binding protein [Chloroflexota bacterium]